MQVATAELEGCGWISNKPEIVEELGPVAENFNEYKLRELAKRIILKPYARKMLEMLMKNMELSIDMGKERMDEGIANPTVPTQDLFKKLDIDKCVWEYHSVRCSLAVGTEDACLCAP